MADVDREGWARLIRSQWPYLSQELLARHLPVQRWFAAKSRGLSQLSVVDQVIVAADPGEALVLLYLGVEVDGGESHLYQFPLCLTLDREAPISQPGLFGTWETTEGKLRAYDGLAAGSLRGELLSLFQRTDPQPPGRGPGVQAEITSHFTKFDGSLSGEAVRLLGSEQSHSALVFGDRLLLKVFRKLDGGLNPDWEIGRFLTERGEFRHMPAALGVVQYVDEGGTPYAVCLLQEFVPNQGQGWEYVLEGLASFFKSIAAADWSDCEPLPDELPTDQVAFRPNRLLDARHPRVRPRLAAAVRDAGTLGKRTAELHAALASDPSDCAFAPERFTPHDWKRARDDVRAQAEITEASLRHASSRCPEAVVAEAHDILSRIPAWLEAADAQVDTLHLGGRIRVHGDFHLGQTLRVGDDFYLLDFEGEPAKPIPQRRRKQSPLRDVVGMLRSFDYAIHAARDAALRDHPNHASCFESWSRLWLTEVSRAYRRAYEEHVAGAPWYPADVAAQNALLTRLLVEKALAELDYELNNRPEWASIPLRGLKALL